MSWQLKKLAEVAEINPRRKTIERDEDTLTSFIPMEAVDGVLGDVIQIVSRPFSEVKKGYTYFEDGDVIFAKITPCMQNGKHAVAGHLIDGFGFGSTEFHVVRASQDVLPEWIHYFLRRKETLDAAIRTFTGAVGQQRVPLSFLENLELPVPSIEQQRQIAARLKAQLAEVETARQAARGQVREASLLRSVILESAIKNISLDAKVLPIDALALNVHYGLSEKMNEFGIGYKIFRMNEIIDGHMSDNGQMKCANISSEEFEKYKLNKGDVLFNRTNSIDHVGKTGLFDLDGDYCFASYLVRIVPDTEKILPSFLALIMNTPSFQRIAKSKASKAINQANINATVMRAMTIPVPANMNEQRSIAAYLKAQLAEVAAVQEAAAAQLAEIERLPQRILARAFNSQGISP